MVCDGEVIVGMLFVCFDGVGGLYVDQLFGDELVEWCVDGFQFCEFGGLVVDKYFYEFKGVLVQIFYLGYLYVYCWVGCDCFVIEVNLWYVFFYWCCFGLLFYMVVCDNL